jgi:lipopolysaccharide export system permease protein
VTDRLDRYLARGIPMDQVAISYVYSLPQFVFWSMPIAALIATVFTIGNMTRHQEIAAAKAGGVSFYRLLRPILVLAAVLSVVAVGLGELIPVTNRMRAEALGERASLSSTMRTNFVYQTVGGPGARQPSAGREPSARCRTWSSRREHHERPARPACHRAAPASRTTVRWRMQSGQLRLLDGNGTELSFSFASMDFPHDAGVAQRPARRSEEPGGDAVRGDGPPHRVDGALGRQRPRAAGGALHPPGAARSRSS